jgi:hypothetical protein
MTKAAADHEFAAATLARILKNWSRRENWSRRRGRGLDRSSHRDRGSPELLLRLVHHVSHS